MFNKYPEITAKSLQALRSTNLLHDQGSYTEECESSPNYGVEQRFVRCAGTLQWPGLELDRDGLIEIARNIREATGDADNYVMQSWHPDYGDYLRVRVESRAYQFLCYLKS